VEAATAEAAVRARKTRFALNILQEREFPILSSSSESCDVLSASGNAGERSVLWIFGSFNQRGGDESGGPRGPPKMTRLPKKWYDQTCYRATTSAQVVVESSMMARWNPLENLRIPKIGFSGNTPPTGSYDPPKIRVSTYSAEAA
jgi:hypothetical protein